MDGAPIFDVMTFYQTSSGNFLSNLNATVIKRIGLMDLRGRRELRCDEGFA